MRHLSTLLARWKIQRARIGLKNCFFSFFSTERPRDSGAFPGGSVLEKVWNIKANSSRSTKFTQKELRCKNYRRACLPQCRDFTGRSWSSKRPFCAEEADRKSVRRSQEEETHTHLVPEGLLPCAEKQRKICAALNKFQSSFFGNLENNSAHISHLPNVFHFLKIVAKFLQHVIELKHKRSISPRTRLKEISEKTITVFFDQQKYEVLNRSKLKF